ncbi:MAG: glycoside hydrolase family 3 C-terminal domain-containing protein [Bacteroidaceae bacterium]|nr:glycoside hydrolase family 3 C-terminal domain-containing protein [Bacteroidaceae bacterium]
MKRILLFLSLTATLSQTKAQSLVPAKVDSLLSLMSSQEKISQLACNTLYTTPENTRLGIPGFLMADGPHGVHLQGYTSFPTGIAMAALWDRQLLQRLGRAMGEEFWAAGQHVGLGPCIDLSLDPRGGRTAESAGEDPYLSGQIGTYVTRGMQEVPVIACLKHFEIEGKQAYRKTCDEQIAERDLMQYFGTNFRTALQEGVPLSLMSSYNLVNGVQANENWLLMTAILRHRWGYPFMVISDWMAIKDADRALRAGNDVCMGSSHYGSQLPKDLTNGDITEAHLDTAVRRVLLTKYATGMIPWRPTPEVHLVDTEEHRQLCREAVRHAVVLLRNGASPTSGLPLLPLTKNARIAVVGPNAKAENLNCYGSSETLPATSVSLWDGIRTVAPEATLTYVAGCDIASEDESGFDAALQAAAEADFVIFAGGLDRTLEGERTVEILRRPFDRDSTGLPLIQQHLISRLAKANPHLIVVLQSGGVVSLRHCIDDIPALLYAFYGGQEAGLGIADVLFGDANPSGRMPLTMPTDDSQLPEWNDTYYSDDFGTGYRWMERQGLTPQFPFGFGLSYTTFQYSNLTVSSVTDRLPVRISADITNTGSRPGDEVVQLYLSSPQAATDPTLPLKELRGYERISLQPGERQMVVFELNAEDFYTWNTATNSYEVLPGIYTAHVGSSSATLPLSATFGVSSEARPDLKVTALFTHPRYPRQGEEVTFYAYVKNQGNAPVPADTYWSTLFAVDDEPIAIYLAAKTDATGLSTPVAGQTLAPGQGTLVMAEGTWTATDTQEVRLSATVSLPHTSEWRTDNNQLQATLRIYQGDEGNAIRDITSGTADTAPSGSPSYNLMGQPVNHPHRGIIITRGKKKLIR